jgi:hypothetical protein
VTGLKVSQRGLTGPPRAFETCGKLFFHSFCPPLRFTDTCGKLFFHNLLATSRTGWRPLTNLEIPVIMNLRKLRNLEKREISKS